MCKPGECFLIESGKYEDGELKHHLFVVLIPFEEKSGKTILVSFSKTEGKTFYDDTLVINEGHPFITDESYAAYYKPLTKTEDEIQAMIKKGVAIPKGTMPEMIVEQLKTGIIASEHTPYGVKELYDDYLFGLL